jgi:hypothetical protein
MRSILSPFGFAALIAGLAILSIPSCGGGGSDDTSGNSGSLGLLITDAPTDGLSVVTVDVTSVQLRRADGSFTGNLLAAPRNFDLLGLAGTRSLLSFVSPAPGVYTGVRVSVDPATVLAYDQAGAAVAVTVTRSTDDANFLALDTSNLTVGGSFQDLLIDINLQKSLRDDAGNPGSLIFELEVEAEHEFEDSSMDEFRGRVVSEDATANRFVANLLDDTGTTSFGQITVVIDENDVLLSDDKQVLGSVAAFFGALQTGAEVEVHGSLTSAGLIQATRVEIEDGLSYPVKIKGDVLAVDSGAQTFSFLWKEVRRGSSLVFPVLAQAGNPRVIEIAWDGNTSFSIEDGGSSSVAGLVPGTEVYVHFLDFSVPMPFLAAGVEFDVDGAEFEGTITDVSGLNGSFVMQLDSDEPAWTSGIITGPVTVALGGVSRIWLDTESEPSLQAGDLLVGLKIEVHGSFSGAPNAGTISASKLKVKPGALEGILTGVNGGAGTISLTISDLDDPFGGAPPAGAIVAIVPNGAHLAGEDGLLSLAGLASLLAGLQAGESVELKLDGINDGFGTILAWEVEARIRD